MKIFKNLILIILIIGTFFVIKDIYKEGTIRLVRFKSENEIMLENDFYIKSDITNIMKNDEYKENNMNKKTSIVLDVPKKYFGYEVDGILKIPKIKLETYIFKEYSEEAMNIARKNHRAISKKANISKVKKEEKEVPEWFDKKIEIN